MHYMSAENLTDGVTHQWVDGNVLFYFILWLYEDVFIKSYV